MYIVESDNDSIKYCLSHGICDPKPNVRDNPHDESQPKTCSKPFNVEDE